MLFFLVACAIETSLKSQEPPVSGRGDAEEDVVAQPPDTGAILSDTSGAADSASVPEDEVPPSDTGTVDTGTPDTDVPDTDSPDLPDDDTPPPTSTMDPCPDAPDIDCPVDILDASACTRGVAAWLPSGRTFGDFQDALDAARAGDTVAVCAGTVRGNWVVRTRDLTVRGYGAATTTLDGGGTGVTLYVEAANLVVSDLTVTGGYTEGFGGGIGAENTDLRLCAAAVTDNEAAFGGGVYVAKGTLEVEGGTFSGNTARTDGGAVGTALGTGPTLVTIVGATFEGNESTYSGGAIFADIQGGVAVYGTTFVGNSTGYEGGAVSFNGFTGGAGACFVDTTFTANHADYAGGAVSSNGWGSMSFGYEGCLFDGNTADFGGGAIAYQQWGTDVSVTVDTLFTGNRSGDHGGAIDLSGGWGVLDASFYQTTFDGNSALLAGAIQAGGVGTEILRIVDGAVTANRASWAGGVYIDATTTVEVVNVDFGTGVTDNGPDDVIGYTGWGAASSFTCSGASCR